MHDDIMEFTGEFRFLSNFYNASFIWDNIFWNHSEGAYQAAKTLDRSKRLYVSELSAKAAKQYGKTIELREDWEEVKVRIMYDIVYQKFYQNRDLRQKLLATDNCYLEEGNNHGDNIWGCCPPRSMRGKNYLGYVLMDVRTALRKL